MISIPPYAFLLGAFIAWIGLMLSWAKHIRDVSEKRRVKAVARGETAPDIRGVSNYERAALRETAHRALHVTPEEKWIRIAITIENQLVGYDLISMEQSHLIENPKY